REKHDASASDVAREHLRRLGALDARIHHLHRQIGIRVTTYRCRGRPTCRPRTMPTHHGLRHAPTFREDAQEASLGTLRLLDARRIFRHDCGSKQRALFGRLNETAGVDLNDAGKMINYWWLELPQK